jgi:hypothetical protein
VSLLNSSVEFIGSGLVQSPESLLVESQGGPLELRSNADIRLSAAATSGAIFYDVNDNVWKVTNGMVGAAPVVSGVNGVPGPNITLEAGANVTIEPDPATNKITISTESAAVIGYSGFRAGDTKDTIITHNLNTNFVVPRFVARSGPAKIIGTFFEPASVTIIDPNSIRIRTNIAVDYDVIVLGMKI